MDFRNALATLFGRKPAPVNVVNWREIGNYFSTFSPYSGDAYANDTVRACVRTLAEHTSKANPRVTGGNKKLQYLLEYRPNLYMNGKDFLAKLRTRLELDNTVFIYINRDERGQVLSLYPVPSCPAEAVESGGRLYIRFRFSGGGQFTSAWDDLAVLRKDYRESDIFGDSNSAISTSLELLDTTNQGMANAIKSTSNLRGLLKFTKAMIKGDDVKAQKDAFVRDFMALDNTSGIAAIDNTMDYVPLKVEPQIADYHNVKELRDNIFRYYGVSEDAILGKLHGDAWEAFYEASIEPFLIALGLELTYKIFSERERGYGNQIVYESNRMQYMSISSKLQLVQFVDRGCMTPNELRSVLNLAPIDGGDIPVRRLDTAPTDQVAESQQDGLTGDIADGELSDNETEKVLENAEDVAGKTLNGAQTQSLITVVSQYAAGSLTIGQAINIIAISIGISKDEAKRLLEGAVD